MSRERGQAVKKKTAVGLGIVGCETGGRAVSSGVGLGRNYKLKKVSERVLFVLRGRGIHYEWIVKRV